MKVDGDGSRYIGDGVSAPQTNGRVGRNSAARGLLTAAEDATWGTSIRFMAGRR